MSGANILAWIKILLLIAAVTFVGWLYWRFRTVSVQAIETATRFNPIIAGNEKLREIGRSIVKTVGGLTIENNVVSQGADRLVTAVSGRDETLGGWLFSIFHDDPVENLISQKLEENPWTYSQEFTP